MMTCLNVNEFLKYLPPDYLNECMIYMSTSLTLCTYAILVTEK